MSLYKSIVLINPKAGNGKVLRTWSELASQFDFLKPFDIARSQKAGDIVTLTRQALREGYDRFLIVGGDGTVDEAVNGFFDNGTIINPKAVLGTLPVGTGCDFLKSFGIQSREMAIQRLRKEKTIACDMAKISYQDFQKNTQNKYFMNISSFGCSGEVVNKVNRSSKWFGVKMAYMIASVTTFLSYQNPEVILTIDDHEPRRLKINNVFICNGKYSGGGMCWGPQASFTDGLLDLTLVKNMTKMEGLLQMRKIYDGRIYEFSGVERIQCKSFSVSSSEGVSLEVDGDYVGTLPVSCQIAPKILIWC